MDWSRRTVRTIAATAQLKARRKKSQLKYSKREWGRDSQSTQPENQCDSKLPFRGHAQLRYYRQGKAQDNEVQGNTAADLGETQSGRVVSEPASRPRMGDGVDLRQNELFEDVPM
jgi:hypothetical protein